MRVLVCGGRDFTDQAILDTVLWGFVTKYLDVIVVQGGAKGADRLAAAFAEKHLPYVPHEEYPAEWGKYGKGAGPQRNRKMLVEGKPDVVLAFPTGSLLNSKGTANMVQQAKAAGVPVYVIERH